LRQDILEIVYTAVDEADVQSLEGNPVKKTPEAPLLGSDQGVDSLNFVNLVVAIEEQIQRKFGKTVILVDEDSIALQEHPFGSIGALASYIEKVINRP